MYYIYMIRCNDDSIYTGITNDIEKRMKEHYYKLKQAAKYTKTRDVVSLDALWTAENRSLASKLEYYLKKLSKQEKEALIKAPLQLPYEEYEYQKDISLAKCLKKEA
ncbi:MULTISPECIES: GIY-YIG nuclease family protein [unclassified Breznakia]|uniref:GIY-YIG nuclease family protein n=1 Tax=unclassified Breznakia TaxID=2623764 RepID=UPI0024071B96|nr:MULTISPECIES: GIY-YIG nuclease family protein [unclassified Breznakia]MDF9838760.1 putative endonuclease [Breznakia sp. PFB2-8]MDF9860778.1 putative endonuclease [Breznakia sp. PH5-24]